MAYQLPSIRPKKDDPIEDVPVIAPQTQFIGTRPVVDLPAIDPSLVPAADDNGNGLPVITPRPDDPMGRVNVDPRYTTPMAAYGAELPAITTQPDTGAATDATTADAQTTLPAVDNGYSTPYDADLTQLYRKQQQDILDRDTHHHSKWTRIAAAVTGWAMGGLPGAIAGAKNPHFFEDIGDKPTATERQIALLEHARDSQVKADTPAIRAEATKEHTRAQIQIAKARQDARIAEIQKKEEAEGKKWVPHTDKNGLMWKMYKGSDKTMERLVNPETQQQEMDPNFDPTIQTTSLLTGTPLGIKASKLYAGEAVAAAGNATREQDAAKTNAQLRQAVLQRNTQAVNDFKNRLQTARQLIATQGATLGTQLPQLGVLQNQLTSLQDRLAALADDKKDPDAVDKKRQAIIAEFNKNQADFAKIAAQSAVGQQALQLLQTALPQPPALEDLPAEIKPSLIKGSKGIISMDTIRKVAAKQKMTPEQAKADAEAQGFIVQ